MSRLQATFARLRGEPAKRAVIASLVVGIGLFIGASALACWRVTRKVLTTRLAILAVTLVAVALLADADPVWPLGAVAVGLLAIVVVEDLTLHRESAADIAID